MIKIFCLVELHRLLDCKIINNNMNKIYKHENIHTRVSIVKLKLFLYILYHIVNISIGSD